MKTVDNIKEIENVNSILDTYSFQPVLTKKLDSNNQDFDQQTINEIVLWKVNRYAELTEQCLDIINQIKETSSQIDEELTKEILVHLLNTKGIRLPMASTILRFKAPKLYQIFDQRVYRYLYGENQSNSTIIEKQINVYLKYLKDLRIKCETLNIDFQFSDRILYQADKIQNASIPIKY